METKNQNSLSAPVTDISGVGKVRAAALARLGIEKVGDLLIHYPRAYEHRGDIKCLEDCIYGEKQAVLLTVGTQPRVTRIKRGMNLLKFKAYDESGSAEITYFNQDYLRDFFEMGATYRFYGKLEKKGKKFELSSPAAERLDEEHPETLPPFVSVYPLTEGISQKVLTGYVKEALRRAEIGQDDPIPAELLIKNKLPTLAFALKNIHFPSDYQSLAAAKRRLIYGEFYEFALALAQKRRTEREHGAPVCSENDTLELEALFPYPLTGAQKRVISEIKADMATDIPMQRLLVGDVGSGKTVCAMAAMLVAVRSGKRAALMAPTEILASQHYDDISSLFGKLGINVALLTGSTPAPQKRRIYAAISGESSERIDVIIGTHALISENVEFENLGVVITDEQHRFGINQREALAKKGEYLHKLVMSATPIPRTLALTLYGDLDISTIDEMPPGRQTVDTFSVDESYRARLDGFIEKQVSEGGQVYIVCPAVEDSPEQDTEIGEVGLWDIDIYTGEVIEKPRPAPIKAAVSYCEELRGKLPHLRIEFVHGKLKAAEKDRIMSDFAQGKTDVLVSTTVIEVGVNVPNACLMIVENAERFGLSQLHQLRGRVGRGSRKSYCILVSGDQNGLTDASSKRLEIMRSTHSGFDIAERDLEMRGPGDFIASADTGFRQSGGIKFRLADMCSDLSLLKAAFRDVSELASPFEKGLDP